MGVALLVVIRESDTKDCPAMAAAVSEYKEILRHIRRISPKVVVDFAAYANRAVVVPLYPTGSLEQLEYIVRDAEIRYLFVGEQYQYDNAWKALATCPTLERLSYSIVQYALPKAIPLRYISPIL